MPESFRVVPRSMRLQVEEALRTAIVNGRFVPGEHLSDRVLCEVFGASRSVVREAVRLLEAEGLITVIPNRGPFVTRISVEEASQIYDVRSVLEGLAGERFARHATAAERVNLRAAFDDLVERGPHVNLEHLLAIKRRFYDVLLAGAHNSHAGRMLEQLMTRVQQLRATSLSAPGRLAQTIEELRQVVEAIERQDPEAAFLACRAHVRQAAEVALHVLASS